MIEDKSQKRHQRKQVMDISTSVNKKKQKISQMFVHY